MVSSRRNGSITWCEPINLKSIIENWESERTWERLGLVWSLQNHTDLFERIYIPKPKIVDRSKFGVIFYHIVSYFTLNLIKVNDFLEWNFTIAHIGLCRFPSHLSHPTYTLSSAPFLLWEVRQMHHINSNCELIWIEIKIVHHFEIVAIIVRCMRVHVHSYWHGSFVIAKQNRIESYQIIELISKLFMCFYSYEDR